MGMDDDYTPRERAAAKAMEKHHIAAPYGEFWLCLSRVALRAADGADVERQELLKFAQAIADRTYGRPGAFDD